MLVKSFQLPAVSPSRPVSVMVQGVAVVLWISNQSFEFPACALILTSERLIEGGRVFITQPALMLVLGERPSYGIAEQHDDPDIR